ncbi:MAG TPA: SMP-30/gluconolactonase/LRE family protein [Xanthobacteraceae bacterium]|nr:SMP-30/gluconolactonase/LRE family protein [Xanthobacteraceae bacterium]
MTAKQRPLGCELGHSTLGAAAIVAVIALPVLAQTPVGIPGVLAPGAGPELVQEGYVFTEGPVGTADGGLYFSDIRVSKTYFLDPGGKISVTREGTNGANGLALTKDGELLFAEGDGKRITKRNRDGTISVLTEGPPGVPLLAPNDLIVDAKGGIYFTDPGPRPVVPGRPTYVYYLPVGAKTPILIDGTVPRPNGLTLTNDGRTLFVDDTLNPTVFAYDVEPDGSVKNKRPFLQLRDIPTGAESGADGMAIDRDGRLYVTTVAGVQVFDAQAQYLGTIKAARQAANVAFGGPDKQTLYLTAREGLYRVKTLAKGPDRLGK